MSQIGTILDELYTVISDRRSNPREGSYTNYLFDKGSIKSVRKSGRSPLKSLSRRKTGRVTK